MVFVRGDESCHWRGAACLIHVSLLHATPDHSRTDEADPLRFALSILEALIATCNQRLISTLGYAHKTVNFVVICELFWI